MSAKVLMFGWEFPPYNSGGLGTACFGLTQALADKKTEITLVLPRGDSATTEFGQVVSVNIPNVSCQRVPGFIYPYITEEAYQLTRSKNENQLYGPNLLAEVFMYADRVAEVLAQADFKIIHAHDWLSIPAALRAKELSGKPLVVHIHATEFDRTGGQGINQQVFEIEKQGMDLADQVIAVSQWTKDLIIEKYGIAAEKIEVIHNGVLPVQTPKVKDRLAGLKKSGARIVLSLGRITLQKGVDYFIRAAAKVLEYQPNTYFVIAGSGDMERSIIELAAKLGIADRVIFTGFLRGSELTSLYQAADVYVMPSVSEPFGIAPLEALVHGTPVIISKQSGVSEVLNHVLKVDFWNVDEMANKIVAVLKHASLQTMLRVNGKREAKKSTWSSAANKCLVVYKKAMLQ